MKTWQDTNKIVQDYMAKRPAIASAIVRTRESGQVANYVRLCMSVCAAIVRKNADCSPGIISACIGKTID